MRHTLFRVSVFGTEYFFGAPAFKLRETFVKVVVVSLVQQFVGRFPNLHLVTSLCLCGWKAPCSVF